MNGKVVCGALAGFCLGLVIGWLGGYDFASRGLGAFATIAGSLWLALAGGLLAKASEQF